MDGDLQTGMTVYTHSTGWTTIGGTSLSSPLAAGMWARMLQAAGTALGDPVADRDQFGQGGLEAVHLPVSRNQRTQVGHGSNLRCGH